MIAALALNAGIGCNQCATPLRGVIPATEWRGTMLHQFSLTPHNLSTSPSRTVVAGFGAVLCCPTM